MSSMLTLQLLPLAQSMATVLVPAVSVTGTVTVDHVSQFAVVGRRDLRGRAVDDQALGARFVLPSPPVLLE
jgi:hypothetical protein